VENLGFGFQRLTIKHVGYFYYRGAQFALIGAPPSISPSGKFAIYQDGPSGKLILFRRADEKAIELIPKFVGVAYPYVWHEDQGTVEIHFQDGHPPHVSIAVKPRTITHDDALFIARRRSYDCEHVSRLRFA
jgi:hypothetical protein